jgi:hypothetical protein
MPSRKWGLAPFFLFLSAAVHAADFDAAGRLTSITHNGTTLQVMAGLVIDLEDGKGLDVAPSKTVRLTRAGDTWRGTIKLPRGTANLEAAWTDLPGKLRLKGTLRAVGAKPLPISGVDYVVYLPFDMFASGQVARVQPEDGSSYRPPLRLPTDAFAGNILGEASTGVTLLDARRNWSIGIQLPEARHISVDEVPGVQRRALRVRIRVHNGALPAGTDVTFAVTLSVVGTTIPAQLSPN